MEEEEVQDAPLAEAEVLHESGSVVEVQASLCKPREK